MFANCSASDDVTLDNANHLYNEVMQCSMEICS